MSTDEPTKKAHVDCTAAVDLLGDYVDDALDPRTKDELDGHLSQCAPCLAFLRQYRFAPQAVRDALLQKVPPDLETKLLSFLRNKLKR
jgi:Putative zinc-finger